MATILCIDDDPRVLETHKALLESNGYRVQIAPDAPTGIAFARKHSIQAVVIDFNMPGMNGHQAAQILRNEHPTIPVIIWSGCPDEIRESLKWFADSLPRKGDGPDALLSVIGNLVGAPPADKKPCARTTCTAPMGGGSRLYRNIMERRYGFVTRNGRSKL